MTFKRGILRSFYLKSVTRTGLDWFHWTSMTIKIESVNSVSKNMKKNLELNFPWIFIIKQSR